MKHSDQSDYHRKLRNNSVRILVEWNSQRRWSRRAGLFAHSSRCYTLLLDFALNPRVWSQRDEGCSKPTTLYRKCSTSKFIMHDCGYFAALCAPVNLSRFPFPYISVRVQRIATFQKFKRDDDLRNKRVPRRIGFKRAWEFKAALYYA